MKIILNFIMKNEEKVLLRMLNSVLPILDGCVCIDTGSNDKSKQIVKDFFQKHKLPCEIYDHLFINFSDARNFALKKLYKSNQINRNEDYGFWIDCDEELIYSSECNEANLFSLKHFLAQYGIGNIQIFSSNTNYARSSFIALKHDFIWKGALHEYLAYNDLGISTGNISNLTVKVNYDGYSHSDKNKYKKHAEILLKEVKKNNDPRDVFYLAQSYNDSGQIEKALQWYHNRANRNDGFIEEKYFSSFMITLHTDKYEDYFMAQENDPYRAEHVLNLILKLQKENLWETSYIWSKYAVEKFHGKNPYPARLLFIDHETYSHKLLDAHIVTCIKTNRKDEILKYQNLETIYNQLCETPSDINFHLPKLKELANKYDHCTEFGVRWGVSTYALLAGLQENKILISYDILRVDDIAKLKALAAQENKDFHYIIGNSLLLDQIETDFLFIDTTATAYQLSCELNRHANGVKYCIAMHDTTMFWEKGEDGGLGLKYAIEPFLQNSPEWKETYRSEENNGLLVLERNAN